MKKINALSLFSSAGIGELLINNTSINISVANELIAKRAECYSFLHPQTKMINGDIRDIKIKKNIINMSKEKVQLLIATPPCQGLSTLGKNKKQDHFAKDKRNYLIFDTFEIIDELDCDYILIENVPKFLDMYFPYKNSFSTLQEILIDKYSKNYTIKVDVLNAKDYGIPQTRPRAIIRMYKKHLNWTLPKTQKEINLKDAIGHLPTLEANQASNYKWHFCPEQNKRAVLALKNTPTGASAMKNLVFYPKKENGDRIKGFHNTFKRMAWDAPAPARTTYCGSMSSHNNVHPGRKQEDGTYSDARVLTLLETFIVHSIPQDIEFPQQTSSTFIRTMIGESIPPLMLKKILDQLTED